MRRLTLIISDITEGKITRENLADIYCVNEWDEDTFPLTYRMINKYQRKYKELVSKLKNASYHTKSL